MPDVDSPSRSDAEREVRVHLGADHRTAQCASVSLQPVEGGLSNFSWRAEVDGESWFVRLARRGTQALGADHRNECRVLDVVSHADIAPRVVRCDPASGLLVTRWIEAVSPSGPVGAPDSDYLLALAAQQARLHALPVSSDLVRVDFAQRARALEKELAPPGAEVNAAVDPLRGPAAEQLLCSDADPLRDSAAQLREIATSVFRVLERRSPRLVLCHNDLNPTNVVVDRAGRPWLVDWEYAGLGDPAFDLASCISQHELRAAACEAFLAHYRAAGGTADAERVGLALWGFDYVQWLWYRAFQSSAALSAPILGERRAAELAQSLRERASSLPHCNN